MSANSAVTYLNLIKTQLVRRLSERPPDRVIKLDGFSTKRSEAYLCNTFRKGTRLNVHKVGSI